MCDTVMHVVEIMFTLRGKVIEMHEHVQNAF